MSGNHEVEALLRIIQDAAQKAVAEYSKDGNQVPTIRSTDSHPLDTATDTVELYRAIRLLEGACQQLCASLAPPQHTVINLVESFDWACTAVVLRAGIANVLVKHPEGLHVSQLSKLVRLEPGNLCRVLRVLALKGYFKEVKKDVFANTRISKVLSSSCDLSCLARILSMDISRGAASLHRTFVDADHAIPPGVYNAPLLHALQLEGDGHQGNVFDWLRADEARQNNFHRAMVGAGSAMGALSILHQFPWDDVLTVCDVGSSIGNFAVPLVKTFPHLRVTAQDLPDVVEQGRIVCAKDASEATSQGHLTFVPLDFFNESPVEGQDVYYLRYIIHDWPDSEALAILRNVKKSMGPHSRLIIHEYVLAGGRRSTAETEDTNLQIDTAPEPMLPNFGAGNHNMYHKDLTMWIIQNGKERSIEEALALGCAVGLKLEKVYDLAGSAALEFSLGSNCV